ncbi:hypothetical protein MMC28_000754 [Mycoblastus sanguinarius]|nr:hypothetical protein [Mycoblastus sanguinarius]
MARWNKIALGLKNAFISHVRFDRLLASLLLGSIILYSLVLAGCASPSAPLVNLYLVSLSYQTSLSPSINTSSHVNPNLTATLVSLTKNTTLEVRTGYFGLCVRYAASGWECSRDSVLLAKRVQPIQDPLDLMGASEQLRDGVMFDGMM